MKPTQWLSTDEIIEISERLVGYGLEQIRVTGGEPTLRKEFREIVEKLSALPLQKLGMTTNGYYLADHLDFLKDTNCRHINISLDSLNREKFNRITRRESFDQVYDSVMRCKDMGFSLKINTVLMRGINDDEIMDFAEFSRANDIEVRFLEVMKIGEACGSQADLFISAGEVIERLTRNDVLTRQEVEYDSTSFNYSLSSGAKISFIASESRPFCGACSRWRLSADGFLRACLMSDRGVRIKGAEPEEYEALLQDLLKMKPVGRIESVDQTMNQIGG